MSLPDLDADQQANYAIVSDALAKHRLAPGLDRWRQHLLPVLAVNMWHESRMRADAGNVDDKESSHGLFQLNMKGGVGAGHDVDELRNPRRNTELILDELNRRWTSDDERARMHNARTVGELAAAFAALVERPGSDRHPDGHTVTGRWGVGEARRATLRSWSPAVESAALPFLGPQAFV